MLPRIANLAIAALQQDTRSTIQDIYKKLPSFAGPDTPPQSTNTSPLPIPRDEWASKSTNGYSDLSDVLRRRQGPFQSNPLWTVMRKVLGSALDFQSKGVISYIIRFIIFRYGWTIIRLVFKRLLRA